MISEYNYFEGNSIKYLVIHGTGNKTDTAINNAKYFNACDRQASAHYFVDDNDIVQVVEEFNGAWHCGDGYNRNGINNQNSIGIEMCCTNYTYSDATVKNTIELVKELQHKYGIPNERVVRHYDASYKCCPSGFADNNWEKWIEFKKMIDGEVIIPVVKVESQQQSELASGLYLNLKPHMESWSIYNMNVKPIKGNEFAYLAPSQYGGLSYRIIEDRGDVKVINTSCFGTVQIYAPKDNDSTFTDYPVYENGSNDEVSNEVDIKESIVKEYEEVGVCTVKCTLNIRNKPSINNEPIGTYEAGESFNYDYVVITDNYVWVSYISYTGVRRYVAITNRATGEKFAECE
ncbi:Putative N-acetylmuramoyl-L-alanine amidase family 2 (fragment) [Clostridium chauvoei JF4335]